MKATHEVKNTHLGTNWKLGARVVIISPWEGGYAQFTDPAFPGASISAHCDEVEEVNGMTLGNLVESDAVFHSENWKLDGNKIVAIHGRDKSTEEKYSKLPEGFVLVSVIVAGKQKQVAATVESIVR